MFPSDDNYGIATGPSVACDNDITTLLNLLCENEVRCGVRIKFDSLKSVNAVMLVGGYYYRTLSI